MNFGVIVFPGSNCDDDIVHVLSRVMHSDVRKVWHKETSLEDFDPEEDCIIIPGGFSYGDYLRAGAIARFSPIMTSVITFAERGGIVLGICNGFQVLCEAGLLPGTLLHNSDHKFISQNVCLRTEQYNSVLTRSIPKKKTLTIPVAHAEGRFYAPDDILEAIERDGQVLFRYCTAGGSLDEAANINGSVHHIAGICNAERNVFGLMPHPERASELVLGNEDGKWMFQSLLESVEAKETAL